MRGMRAKLGIFNEEPQDESLIKDLLNMMHKHGADYTNTFRALTLDKLSDMDFFDNESFSEWHEKWTRRLGRQEESKDSSHKLMKSTNPAIIPRNYRVEESLEAAEKKGDYSIMEKLLNVISNPYAHTEVQEDYATLPPKSSCGYRTFCGT